MSKKLSPIEGMDYVPIPGANANIGFGVVRRELSGGISNTAFSAALRRIRPVGRQLTADEPWQPTCYRSEVLLCDGASDALQDPKVLCASYEAQAFDGTKDLFVIATLRFPNAISLHQTWRRVRDFAYAELVDKWRVAVLAVMHVPALAGKAGPPHVHLLIPARRLESYGFGEFLRPLSTDKGREIIEASWAQWPGAT